jgi:hypothetical protein
LTAEPGVLMTQERSEIVLMDITKLQQLLRKEKLPFSLWYITLDRVAQLVKVTVGHTSQQTLQSCTRILSPAKAMGFF